MQNLMCAVVFICFLGSVKSASAQNSYVNHTLKQGESLSALAKQYNTNVGDIMRINGMHAGTKLVYGSTIKIPGSKKIATQETAKTTAQQISKTPENAITHKVAKGETLFSISKQYNVSVNDLKTWNHLINNSAQLGSVLIIKQNSSNDATAAKPIADVKRQRVETTQLSTTTPGPIIQQKTETPDTAVEIAASNNAIQSSTPNADSANTSNNVVIKTDNGTADAAAQNEASFDKTKNPAGYFADAFKKSRRQQHLTGISKTFKTASGWNDGKYYILADNITPGTIVKLTAENGSTVYAKVLWNMGDLKENNGVNFRISNATAAALNEQSDSFNLNVSY